MSRTAKYYFLGVIAALTAPCLLLESIPALARLIILFVVQVLFVAGGYQLGRRESEYQNQSTRRGTT